MPVYKLPKRLHSDFSRPNKKPIDLVEIDYSNPLTKGLLYYFIWQDNKPYDLVSKQFVDLSTASIARKFNIDGAYIDHSGRAEASTYSPWSDIGTSELSIFSKFRQPITSRETLVCSRVSSNVNHIEIRLNSANTGAALAGSIALLVSGTSTQGIAAGSAITGDWQTVVGVRNGTTFNIHVDGDQVFSDTRENQSIGGSPTFVFGGLPGTTVINFTGDRSVDIGWSRALTEEDARLLDRDPFQLLKPKTPAVYFTTSVAPGGVTVNVPVGSITLTGQTPTIDATANITVSIPVGAIALTGQAPTVLTGDDVEVSVPLGAISLTGLTPVIQATNNISVDIPLGSISLATFAPTIQTGDFITVEVPAGAISLSGFVPAIDLTNNIIVSIPVGSISLTGFAPVVDLGDLTVNVNSGTITLSGFAPIVIVGGAVWTVQPDSVTNWSDQADSVTTWTIQ